MRARHRAEDLVDDLAVAKQDLPPYQSRSSE